jgi:exopolysaccharide production protein ExoZ
VSFDLKGYKDFVIFLKKIFIRINPSYWFASIIALILRYISKPYIDFPYEESIKSFTILPIIDYGNKFWQPILYIGWTLAFEWLFYLIFAVLILFSVNKKNLFLILFLGILTFTGAIFPINNIQYTFITNPIVWEFCMGVLIAVHYKGSDIPKYYSLITLIVAMLMYVVLVFKGFGNVSDMWLTLSGLNSWKRFFIWGIPSALIVWGAVFFEKSGFKYFNNKIILLLGNASFAIYLVHTLVISFLNKFFYLLKFISLDIVVILTLIISVIAGVIYYKYIEQPLAKYCHLLMFRNKK